MRCAGIANWVLFGYFYGVFLICFMVLGSLGARASQSLSQPVGQSVSQSVSQPSGQAVSESVSQSVRLPTEPSISLSVCQSISP